MHAHATNSNRNHQHSLGFTLTELLVVIAIIVLLIGTLFVALGSASKRAQRVKTEFLLNSISSGLAQFNTDFGYFPPVLGKRDTGSSVTGFARDVVPSPQVTDQNWYSYTTLAEYLIGYGNRGEDGYGIVRGGPAGAGNKEAPPFGIRSPGSDGCWGAIDAMQPNFAGNTAFAGYYRARNPSRVAAPPAVGATNWNSQAVEGRVYGPYIDTIDERILGGLTGFDASGRPTIVTADQLPASSTTSFDQLPKVILDYWGEPIAYYRAPYAGTDLRSSVAFASGSGFTGFLNLGDIFVLREWEIKPSDQSVGVADTKGDTSSSAALKGASFALLSKGPDRSYDRTARRDTGEFNKDNIVQAGK